MAVTITSAASSYKLTTVANFKEALGITSSTDDTLIGKLIDRASASIVRYCNRSFAKETVTETLKSKGTNALLLSRFPVVSVTSVAYDGTTVAASEYSLQEPEQGLLFNATGWNYTYGEALYSVVYEAGYVLPSFVAGTINLPYDIEEACIELTKSLYYSRTINPAIASESVPDVYSVTYADPSKGAGVSTMPATVKALLTPYRKYNI